MVEWLDLNNSTEKQRHGRKTKKLSKAEQRGNRVIRKLYSVRPRKRKKTVACGLADEERKSSLT